MKRALLLPLEPARAQPEAPGGIEAPLLPSDRLLAAASRASTEAEKLLIRQTIEADASRLVLRALEEALARAAIFRSVRLDELARRTSEPALPRPALATTELT